MTSPDLLHGNGYYVVTPLIESLTMSKICGGGGDGNGEERDRVFLKFENCQPSQSYKLRGISHLMIEEVKKGAKGFVTASGGNAGMAAAFVARRMRLPLKVFVPATIKKATVDILTNMEAEVEIVAGEWQMVDEKAKAESVKTNRPYIHPFDHPLLWEGHASMIEESSIQLGGLTPDLVVVSVGGGGLLMGVARGMEKVGWGSVPILALETVGTSCFSQSLAAGRLITLDAIKGIATSLGATRVTPELLVLSKKRRIISKVVEDKHCVISISKFLDDHLMLVEPACGASLSSVYCRVIDEIRDDVIDDKNRKRRTLNILIIVCGGKVINWKLLQEFKREFSVE